MTVRRITEYPEDVLARAGESVTDFGEEFQRLVSDMFETMYAAEGVGLAAPQIDLSLRLFVMDCDAIKLVAANPELVETEGVQDGEEGCLSVGKIHARLSRAERVRLRAQDEHGEFYEREATGLAARCFQHETDHCDGRLFSDRLSPLKRDMVKKRFQKIKRARRV
ncbi:MAG TPA: peptide deformylase [Pyrinomonadaceae bacterium]|nr:peptide deformylase [Pyrinomonadaceae bacterium]